MRWEPRRAGRRDQPRDTPGDPGSERRVRSGRAPRDGQRGVPWPGEERPRSQPAQEWLKTSGGSQGQRPAVTGSPPSHSASRYPGAGQPSTAGVAGPPGSGRTADGYPAERYGRGEAGGPERRDGGAGAPGERFVRQRRSAEPSAERRFARPEAAPTGPRTPDVTGAGSAAAAGGAGRPDRAGTTAAGPRVASQPDFGQATREPGERGRGLSPRHGPGSLPRPHPRTAPPGEERRLPEPGRAPQPGRHARDDPGARQARRPDERALLWHDAADAAGSTHRAAAGIRAKESRMPPGNGPRTAAPPDTLGRVDRPVPHPAPGMSITSAADPDDETIPLPVILRGGSAARSAGHDGDAVAPGRPARRRADGPRDRDRGRSPRPLPAQMQAKLDQLKALYRTAEAIGEEALTRHFDQLSQRQRDLIRDYFEQAGLGRTSGGWGISDADSTPRVSPRSTPLPPPY